MKSVVTCVVLAAAFFVGVFISTSARLSEPVAGALQLRAINQAIALGDRAEASQAAEEKVRLKASADFSRLSADESAGPSPLQKLSELVHAFVGFVTALGAWFLQISGRVYGWLRNEVGMFSEDGDDSDEDDVDEEEDEDDFDTRINNLEAKIDAKFERLFSQLIPPQPVQPVAKPMFPGVVPVAPPSV